MATVSVCVDVDISEFDDDDLIEEVKERGLFGVADEETESIREIYYAIRYGKDDLAMELTRKFVCDHLGRVI